MGTNSIYILGLDVQLNHIQVLSFPSWEENLGKNSTQLINTTTPSSDLDPILDFLHISTAKPESKLSIGKFGNFTANFKALSPPIPPEYVVVATAFIGSWLTPTVIGWRKARIQRRYVKSIVNYSIGNYNKLILGFLTHCHRTTTFTPLFFIVSILSSNISTKHTCVIIPNEDIVLSL